MKQWVRHGLLNSQTKIENYIKYLIKVLQDTVKVVGQVPAIGRGKTAPWWTDDCKKRHTDYRIAKATSENVELTRKAFRATVKAAKREF